MTIHSTGSIRSVEQAELFLVRDAEVFEHVCAQKDKALSHRSGQEENTSTET